MAVLAESDLKQQVSELDGWEVRGGALEKSFDRGDFDGSIAFVNTIAKAANEADHHPDISVAWDMVTLRWVNHAEGGITEKDVAMARKSDELA
jgi:4a-hydroxytetrahydrobiopterin dehydratase